jgi:hypothetical protein
LEAVTPLSIPGDEGPNFIHETSIPHGANALIQCCDELISLSMESEHERALLPGAVLSI